MGWKTEEMRAALDDLGDARFARAVQFVLEHEGGLVDDPDDPGGTTKWGVSLRFLHRLGELDDYDVDFNGDGVISADDVKLMTPASALAIYKQEWWNQHRYGELRFDTSRKVFDLAVNMGAGMAHRCLQRSARAAYDVPLVDDGILGPRTRAAIERGDEGWLLAALRSEAAGYYRTLIARKPVREKYRNGWLSRAYA